MRYDAIKQLSMDLAGLYLAAVTFGLWLGEGTADIILPYCPIVRLCLDLTSMECTPLRICLKVGLVQLKAGPVRQSDFHLGDNQCKVHKYQSQHPD